jgi:hypothetical protein
VYGPERAIFRDPRSGLRILRLTHYSSISMNLYFEMCAFTPDERHVVLLSQRGAGRDAPWDLMRARTDGMELVQMTEVDHIGGIVVSPPLGAVLYQCGSELRKVDILSLREDTIAHVPGEFPGVCGSLGAMDAAGCSYFGSSQRPDGTAVLFRVELASGVVTELYEGTRQVHIHVDPAGTTVYFAEYDEVRGGPYMIDANGANLRRYCFDRFAHHTWFGETGLMQGCLLPPGHALVTYREGDAEPEVITGGRYYWHSSASDDAQWIVSDTNWPREGLYVVHVPTRTVTFLCDPLSSCSHPQWTHPHPSFSPNMSYVLFNSDMTGIGQVYLVELTDEFRAQAAQGYHCVPQAPRL